MSLSEVGKLTIFYGNSTDDLFSRSPSTLDTFSNDRLGVIESGDLNDDGLGDLVVCNQARSDALHDTELFILLNTGDDRQFKMNSFTKHHGCHISVVIGNFDHDGKRNDISVYGNHGYLLIFQSIDFNRKHSILHNYLLHGDVLSQTIGKFNDDEFDDLALIIPQTDHLQIMLAYDNDRFTKELYFTASNSTSITRIHFNNDQIDDLAVLSCNRTLTVFLGTPSGFFNKNYLSFELNERNSTQCAHSLKVTDLNQDGIDDLVFIDAEIQYCGFIGHKLL